MNTPSSEASSVDPQKKTQYFQRFALAHLNALHAHASDQGQQLAKSNDPNDSWRNVVEHCLVAGAFADLLARRLGLPVEEVKHVADAAVLHDWNKKKETQERRGVNKIGRSLQEIAQDVRAVVEERKRAGDQDLAGMTKKPLRRSDDISGGSQPRYSQEVIQLTEANVPKDTEGPQTDAEKILWYVDAMLTGTKPERIDDRFDALESHPKNGPDNIAFSHPYSYRDGEQKLTLYDLQRRIGKKLSAEFTQRLGFEHPDDLPLKLREMLEQEIAAQV